MSTKPRSQDQTATSISLPKALLDEIELRAQRLGLSRSAYLCALARADIARGGTIELCELHDGPPAAPAPRPSKTPVTYRKTKS